MRSADGAACILIISGCMVVNAVSEPGDWWPQTLIVTVPLAVVLFAPGLWLAWTHWPTSSAGRWISRGSLVLAALVAVRLARESGSSWFAALVLTVAVGSSWGALVWAVRQMLNSSDSGPTKVS